LFAFQSQLKGKIIRKHWCNWKGKNEANKTTFVTEKGEEEGEKTIDMYTV